MINDSGGGAAGAAVQMFRIWLLPAATAEPKRFGLQMSELAAAVIIGRRKIRDKTAAAAPSESPPEGK